MTDQLSLMGNSFLTFAVNMQKSLVCPMCNTCRFRSVCRDFLLFNKNLQPIYDKNRLQNIPQNIHNNPVFEIHRQYY